MYTLKDNGVITEITCGNNFEYVLKDNAIFVNTDYKVLQSQNNGIFVKCMKMTRNGLIALYYITDEYKPMQSLLDDINADTLVNVVINLFASVIEVRNNGFLACQCIDLSWDKIFVEQNTLEVKLVYLPLRVKVFEGYTEFENELRAGIVRLANKVISTSSARLDQLLMNLGNDSLTLEDIYNNAKGDEAEPVIEQDNPASNPPADDSIEAIRLVAMNASSNFELVIDKPDVVIGKKQELADSSLPFNERSHRNYCRVSNLNGVYYISDEGSISGTFVNGTKLYPGQKVQIKHGDIIRMMNNDFQVI